MVDALILGLDALDSALMKQFLIEGHLPTFSKLSQEGKLNLESIRSYKSDNLSLPHTPQAWTCIYTGGDETHHGVTTGDWRKGTVDFVDDVPSTVFDDVSIAGLTTHSFRMAMTWPARDINGWMLSGFPSGQDEGVAKSEVWGLEDSMLPERYADVQDHWIKKNGSEKDMLNAEDEKFDMVQQLVQQTVDPEVLFYGTQIPDKMAHKMTDAYYGNESDNDLAEYPYMKLTYRKIDSILERAIEELDPEMIIGISDHGFDRFYGGHSMRACIFEYSKNPELVDDGILGRVDDITDFRDYFCERMGIERQSKHVTYNGAEDSITEITHKEKESMEKRLEDMGYM